jgi:hypothetical protein
MLGAPKVFVKEGGGMTFKFAVAVFPGPALLEVTVTLFTLTPGVVPVTFTANVQGVEIEKFMPGNVAPNRLTLEEPGTAVIIPLPQDAVSPLGVATTNPEGNASVNPTPVSAILLFTAGFVTVNANEVVPFKGIVGEPNALVITGGLVTVSVAAAVLPVPPFEDVTVVVLVKVPDAVAITFSVIVQLAPEGSVNPDSETPDPPGAAAIDPLAPHELVKPLGEATTIPPGRLSAKLTPVSAELFGLLIEKLSTVVPFTGTNTGENAFVIAGGTSTTRVADAAAPVPPSVDVIAPVVLFLVPAVVPVTLTTMEQELFAARFPPVSVMLPDPATAVSVPPH